MRPGRIIERLFCNSTLTGNYFNGAQNHWESSSLTQHRLEFPLCNVFVLSRNWEHFLFSVVFHILTYQPGLKRIRNCLIHPLTISSDLHRHKTPLVIFSHVITRVDYVTFLTPPVPPTVSTQITTTDSSVIFSSWFLSDYCLKTIHL